MHHRGCLGHLDYEGDATRGGHRPRRLNSGGHDPVELDVVRIEREPTRFDLRGEQQVADEPQQPMRVALGDPEIVGLLVGQWVVLVITKQFEVAED